MEHRVSPLIPKILRPPQMQVLSCPSATGKAIQRSLTRQAAHQRAKSPRLPVGCLAEVRLGSLKSHINAHEGRFFYTLPRNKPRNVSDDHTELFGRVHALRYRHDAVAVDVLLVLLKAGCCKDAVDFAVVVCGTYHTYNCSCYP